MIDYYDSFDCEIQADELYFIFYEDIDNED